MKYINIILLILPLCAALLAGGCGDIIDAADPHADPADLDNGDPGSKYVWTRTLDQGMSGDDVAELQIRIAGWAADSPEQAYSPSDGNFNSITADTVRRFQRAYGLTADGIVEANTQSMLNALQRADGSTVHFNFKEFMSKDGSGFEGGKVESSIVKENVRRLMYKLEALRVKCGNNPVTINSGFRSIAHNRDLSVSMPADVFFVKEELGVSGELNSQHLYGIAGDIVVADNTVEQVRFQAKTCGFSGIIRYSSFTHVDSRMEYPYGEQLWHWIE